MKTLLLFFFLGLSIQQCYGQFSFMLWEKEGLTSGDEFEVISIPEYLNSQVDFKSSFIPSQIENAHNLKKVNLAKNYHIADWDDAFMQLSKVPSVKEIDLSLNLFEKLPLSTTNLDQVEQLVLRACHHLDFEQAFGLLKDMEKLKKLDLTNNSFEQLPENIKLLQQLEELDLSYNPFLDYQHLFSIIEQMPNLKVLYLENNELKKIPIDLNKIKHLEGLFFSHNENLDIDALITALKDFRHLKTLDLEFISAKELPNTIGNLVSLEELNMDDNFLVTLPSSITKLTKLQKLYLRGNEFEDFPKEICELTALKILKIYSNKNIKVTIPEEFSNLKDLEYAYIPEVSIHKLLPFYKNFPKYKSLEIRLNKNETIPSIVQEITQLEEVLVMFNNGAKIEESLNILAKNRSIKKLEIRYFGEVVLPSTLGKFKNLEELNFYTPRDQKLTIPKEIGELSALKKLIVSRNFVLSDLPKEFGNLRQLDSLVLTGTSLSSLPESIGGLKNLTHLDISNCPIKTLPKSIGKLKLLQSLNISFSKLKQDVFLELPEEFGNCKSLKFLNAQYSNLQKLPTTFGNLSALEILDLSNNQLEILPNNFGLLKSLKLLTLKSNNLSVLTNTFGSLKNLRYLDLSNQKYFRVKDFHKEITALAKLQYLAIDLKKPTDSIVDIPKGIENLTNLTAIDLKINGKTNWSSVLQNLGALKQLKIVTLALENAIPKEIHHLQYVTDLELRSSTLSKNVPFITLTEGLGKLKNLKSLTISRDELKELSKELTGLKSLHYLYLSCDYINWESTFNILGQIPKLKTLEIKHCKIPVLPHTINSCKTLEVLDISLTTLVKASNELTGMSNLKTLDLSFNKLVQLPNELYKLTKLSRLDVSNNKIGDLPIGLIYLKNVKFLSLSSNSIPDKVIDFYKNNTTSKNISIYH